MSGRHMRFAAAGALAAVVVGGACQFLFPFSLDNLTETRVRAICHLAYACCTPIERQLKLNAGFKDEGACVSELLEDQSLFGSLFTADAIAREAVARGTATYDAEAAERCSRPLLDAANSCAAEELFNDDGTVNQFRALFLIDDTDPECIALAGRGFTRGTQGDEDECEEDVDCADFGDCIPDPDAEEDVITKKGICRPLAGDGDDCSEVGCQPGLVCNFEDNTCEEFEPLGNGEPCTINGECESGFCEDTIENGTCVFGGQPCVADEDCGEDDFCGGDFVSECADPPDVTIEVCDGQ